VRAAGRQRPAALPFPGSLAPTWTDALQYREPEKEAAPWSEAS
jgi:hypothetical protein